MDKNTANRILLETEAGYDLIADKFSQTRKHFWAELEFIRSYIKADDNVLDFGCGNGRLLAFLKEKSNINYQGVDVSTGLIEKAKELNSDENAIFSKINPSQTSLAFEDNFFNAVYSIAVFHHIPSKELRLYLAKELFRITKREGVVVITVWNLWQEKYKKNIFKNWKNKIFGKIIRMSGIRSVGQPSNSLDDNLDWNDCSISFTDNIGKRFDRFHHAFTKGELQKLFESAGFETERCEIVGGRNIVYVGRKL